MAQIRLRNLTRAYGALRAVDDVSLEIRSGDFFSILGPSGCGKSTLLRLIAGFEAPTAGTIMLDDRDITHIPPRRRAVGMIFQNYALFPTMTVYQNVAFGLEAKRLNHSEIQRRVHRVLDAVRLLDRINAPVTDLSGGEQQRVAVARAIVLEPEVLLYDEPLSNLDVALRHTTREEIRLLQRTTGITTIYVTHDQSEAMSLSDRIAVMQQGKMEQLGEPHVLYEQPSSLFVARFLGGANVIGARRTGPRRIVVDGREIRLPDAVSLPESDALAVAVKPEMIGCSPVPADGSFEGTVMEKEYLGFTTLFTVSALGGILKIAALSSRLTAQVSAGDRVHVAIDWARCSYFRGPA